MFALPSPTDKLFPKCKSHLSRSAYYDLLVEMVRGCLANYSVLHGLLVLQHQASSHKPYPWEYLQSQGREQMHSRLEKLSASLRQYFIDLLSKTEEMTPELKIEVKKTFCGTLSNNVVSLDCGHVSTTTKEIYTVWCQVAEMRSLYQSLDEVCVKDMLEGDNMYTCSQCSTKVRAEKRACFKSLPDILAFNTMRYSFNMVTMMEKVNTHFSFPFRLDMTPYMEHTLIPKKGGKDASSQQGNTAESYAYELIGVTVHTGTADGGHYYAFIRDRTSTKDKWFSFNDAEVKSFNPNQIAAEGEMVER